MHKATVAIGSPPSAPLNGITELFDQPYYCYGERNICLRTECMYSRLTRNCARRVRSATTAGCADIDPCRTPCICERLSTPSEEGYARIMLRGSTTLKTAEDFALALLNPAEGHSRCYAANTSICY